MAGVALAEAYVLRKLHKEKMKVAEEKGTTKTGTIGSEAKISSGCFFWRSKNEHKRTARIRDYKEKETVTWEPNAG